VVLGEDVLGEVFGELNRLGDCEGELRAELGRLGDLEPLARVLLLPCFAPLDGLCGPRSNFWPPHAEQPLLRNARGGEQHGSQPSYKPRISWLQQDEYR